MSLDYRLPALERADRRCEDCGSPTSAKGLPLHVHHIAKGGGDELSNLRVLCHLCHKKYHLKGSRKQFIVRFREHDELRDLMQLAEEDHLSLAAELRRLVRREKRRRRVAAAQEAFRA